MRVVRRDDFGFAILEILAVMTIIAALSAIAVTQYSHWSIQAHLTTVRADAKRVGDALYSQVAHEDAPAGSTVSQTGDDDVLLSSKKVGSLSPDSFMTGFETDGSHVRFSVYRGGSPESATVYASYSSAKGGLCSSGKGPVQECDPLDGSTTPTPGGEEPDPTPTPTTPPVTETPPPPPPIGPATVTTPTSFIPPTHPVGLACQNGATITQEANSSGATHVNLVFTWDAVPGAGKYDVHLSPLTPGGSKVTVKRVVTGTSITVTMPRPPVQWTQPVPGADTSFYGQYSLRILPHVGGKSLDPNYIHLQYQHNNIGCWGNVTFENRRPPIPMFNPHSIAYSLTKNDSTTGGTATVNFTWAKVPGATSYRVSVFGEGTANAYGADALVTDEKLTVVFPRKALDRWGNPVGGQNADYYSTYWIRVQPIGSDWDGDSRYRKFRYYHYDNGLHAPDGYY